jgi:hypothetical protein
MPLHIVVVLSISWDRSTGQRGHYVNGKLFRLPELPHMGAFCQDDHLVQGSFP